MNVRNIILSLLFLFPMTAAAEIFAESSGIDGNNYFGVLFSGLTYEEDVFNFHETAGTLRLGREFSRYFAVEGRLGAGLTNDKKYGYIDVGIDRLAGIYARANIFLWDPKARFYILAGATNIKQTAEAFGISDVMRDTEVGYGLGFEVYGDNRNGINLELMRYMDGKYEGVDYTLDAFSVGYVHRF